MPPALTDVHPSSFAQPVFCPLSPSTHPAPHPHTCDRPHCCACPPYQSTLFSTRPATHTPSTPRCAPPPLRSPAAPWRRPGTRTTPPATLSRTRPVLSSSASTARLRRSSGSRPQSPPAVGTTKCRSPNGFARRSRRLQPGMRGVEERVNRGCGGRKQERGEERGGEWVEP
eukprot:356940-Chlamydomonas_euryale.AAC.3